MGESRVDNDDRDAEEEENRSLEIGLPVAPQPDGQRSPSAGFARLARRISSWTSKCLLSLMVLVAGLAFGRQVLDWWGEDGSQSVVSLPGIGRPHGQLTDPAETHLIELGDSAWCMARRSIAGDRAEAVRALRATCVELMPSAGLPPGQPDAAEGRFLESIAQHEPVAEEPGQWQLFEVDGPLPTAAGIRLLDESEATPGRKSVAPPGCRVVTWGIAMPSAEGEWTLFAFHSPTPSRGPLPGLPEVPLPAGSTRLLSIQAAGGGSIVAFRHEDARQADRWRPFFDDWFQSNGWAAARAWRPAGGGWHQQYTGADPKKAGSVEIRFGPDGRGGLSGLLFINPPEQETS